MRPQGHGPVHQLHRLFGRTLLQLERRHRLRQRGGTAFELRGLLHSALDHAGVALRDFVELTHCR
mgnify:CR=1 FL=1